MEPLLEAIFLSVFPFSEVRGGIPYALYQGIDPLQAFLILTAANIIIIPFIFLFLDHINSFLMRIPLYRNFFERVVKRTRKKARGKIEKYGYLGLTLFVAIPLPFTGAYTGALAAWIFGMRKKRRYLAIALGVLIASVIVTIVSYYGISYLSIFTKT